jgi:hypothetical protein
LHQTLLAQHSFALSLAYVPKFGFSLGEPLSYQRLTLTFRKMRQARQYRVLYLDYMQIFRNRLGLFGSVPCGPVKKQKLVSFVSVSQVELCRTQAGPLLDDIY